MKKRLFFCICIVVCAILSCAFALADDHEVRVILDGQDAGFIKVPEDVIVLTEKNGANGIVCYDAGGGDMSVSLGSYDFFHGGGKAGLHEAEADDRIVIIELEQTEVDAGAAEGSVSVIAPRIRTGRLKDRGTNSLTLSAFELKGSGDEEKLVSREDWEEYNRYVKDEHIHYHAGGGSGANSTHEFDAKAETYHLKGEAKGELELEFDVDIDRDQSIFWNHYTIDTKVVVDMKSLVIESESDGVELLIPLPPIVLTMGVQIPISFIIKAEHQGKMGLAFTKGFYLHMEFDLGFCKPDFKEQHGTVGGDVSVIGENVLSVMVGMETGMMIDLFEVFEAGIAFDAGFVFDNTWYHDHFFIDDNEDKNVYHACDKCYYLEISPVVGPLSLKVVVVKIFSRELPLIPEQKFDPVYTYHYSYTFDDDHGPGKCPLLAYRVNVTVKDEKGNPISGATVSYDPPEEIHFSKVYSETTGTDGKCTLYLPAVKTGTTTQYKAKLTAVVQDPLDPKAWLSASADLAGMRDAQEANLVINTKACAVTFKDPGSGTVTNMPGTIHFHPDKGPVNIPDDIPEKAGVLFTGWNTKADGTGDSVAPGTKLQAKDDVTLYAQWEILGKNYIVQYNANGGTYAPESQLVKYGDDAKLTDEPARWDDKHTFIGWAYTDDAMVPDFPAGRENVLPCPAEQYIVTLYAMWQFDPVIPPIRIHFDMNGGPDDRAPSDQWIEPGSWMTIPTGRNWWDEIHRLKGWSTDPKAEKPDYFSGRSYLFNENTTFYAVWEKLPVCTLSFADPAGNDTANMPESVLFAPDVSPWVTVPDTIPRKSGRYFTGWNTEPDGSGTEVQPGAAILLYGDTTLYAQWEVIGSMWVVSFNANGGEKAPRPQVCPNGQDMTLTTAEAVWTNHQFLGWSRSPDADTPEYPAGQANVIPYADGKDGLVLYAVWGFHPVAKPVHLTYDMNGGPETEKPAGRWMPAGSWTVLDSAVPAWDGQHIFLGWSRSAGAKQPDCRPGDTIRIDGDTTLYAVWNVSYRITEGNGATWYRTSGKGLRFTADGSLRYFRFLRIDGQMVPAGDYDLSSGSTVADLHKAYLRSLSDGAHSISFVYSDGTADGTFTVTRKLPPTGDRADPVLWVGLILLALTLLAAQRRLARGRKR